MSHSMCYHTLREKRSRYEDEEGERGEWKRCGSGRGAYKYKYIEYIILAIHKQATYQFN